MTTSIENDLRATLAGTHTIERELGGGGMSRLFLARELRFNRQVVVKVLSPRAGGELSAERFQREIAVAANLQHPNIVPVLTAGETGGLPYFTMPFVEGESLRARLKEGPIPPDEIETILADVARALACAHSNGIVHRDIKPENILLSRGAATVTDFGVSKALSASAHEADEDEGLTIVGTSLGTPAYMAPEQAAGESVDARADLYAWGVVGYEMIAGRHPFSQAKNAQQLTVAHIQQKPQPLSGMRAGVSAALRKAVMKCLEKDPAKRPADADALLRSISSRHARRVSAQAMIGAGLALLLVVGGGVAFIPRDKIATVMALASRKPSVLHNNRVIVLPFSNETGDSALTPLGAMAADWISQGLTRSGTLDVVDAPTVEITSRVVDRIPWPFRGRDQEKAMANETGAGLLISGRFYKDGELLRFQPVLINVADKKLMRSITAVSGPASAPTRVIDSLQKRVVAALVQTADTISSGISALSEPPSVDAYSEFKKGLEAFFSHDTSAFTHYRKAAALDTSYVTPWVFLAIGGEDWGDYATAQTAMKHLRPISDRLAPAERAITEFVDAKLVRDAPALLRGAEAVYRLTPGSSESPLIVGQAALYLRKPRRVLEVLQQVDPDRGLNLAGAYYWREEAAALYQLGKYSAAVDVCEPGRKRFPNDRLLQHFLLGSLARLGRTDDMERVVEGQGGDDAALRRVQLANRAVESLVESGHGADAARLGAKWLNGFTASGEKSLEYRLELANLMMRLGHWPEAKAQLDPIVRDARGLVQLDAMGSLGVATAHLGQPGDVARIDAALVGLSGSSLYSGFPKILHAHIQLLRARIQAQLGRVDQSVMLASDAQASGWEMSGLLNQLGDDYWLMPDRTSAAFQRLTAVQN